MDKWYAGGVSKYMQEYKQVWKKVKFEIWNHPWKPYVPLISKIENGRFPDLVLLAKKTCKHIILHYSVILMFVQIPEIRNNMIW